MYVTCTCGQAGPMSEMHLDTLGDGFSWLCDTCYFSRQPWHNQEDSSEGIY